MANTILSLISNIFVVICLLGILLLLTAILYRSIRKTPVDDLSSLTIASFGTAGAVSFLFYTIGYILKPELWGADVDKLIVAALIGSVALTIEALKRYLRYFGIDIEYRKKSHDE